MTVLCGENSAEDTTSPCRVHWIHCVVSQPGLPVPQWVSHPMGRWVAVCGRLPFHPAVSRDSSSARAASRW